MCHSVSECNLKTQLSFEIVDGKFSYDRRAYFKAHDTVLTQPFSGKDIRWQEQSPGLP